MWRDRVIAMGNILAQKPKIMTYDTFKSFQFSVQFKTSEEGCMEI